MIRLLGSLLIATTAVLVLAASPCGAADGEEYTLDQSNWQKAEGLLPDPVLKRLKAGDYTFHVVPLDAQKFRENYSSKFWAASESNEGKYELDADTCGLKDKTTGQMPTFVFGEPFPRIDPKDPQAACKIAWNFQLANWMGEGQGATFTLNGIDRNGEFKRIKTWLHSNTYLGRHSGPTENPENLRATTLSHALEPQDVEGVNILTQVVNDWHAQDNIWAYVPSTRRVRRVNAAQRSDPIAGLDIFGDDLNCYAGKVEYYKWKLVGEGEILAPLVGPYAFKQTATSSPTRFDVNIPYLRGAYETPGAKGAPWQVTENLVLAKRPVYIVEGQSNDPYYNFGKVVMYFDKEMFRIYWKMVHNRAGEYFYTAMCSYHFSKSDDGQFSATTPDMVMGVNDKTDRAALGGRYQGQFIERKFDPGYFSLRKLSHLSD
jgi:hypothetical protein